jgi:hypothetical protein
MSPRGLVEIGSARRNEEEIAGWRFDNLEVRILFLGGEYLRDWR